MKPLDPFKDFGVEVPRPKKFPLSFDEMLRYLMPQVETKDRRQKRFFDFLQDTPRAIRKEDKLIPDGKISLQDACDLLEKMKMRDHGEISYCLNGMGFMRWWLERLSTRRAEVGKRGGRPKSSKNNLEGENPPENRT